MEHVLTEQQLAAFEAKYRRDTRISLSWEELQSLTAEIRRCWDEVEEFGGDADGVTAGRRSRDE